MAVFLQIIQMDMGFPPISQNAPDWQPEAGLPRFLVLVVLRAVVVALIDAGVPEIMVSNRTRRKAEALRDDFGARISIVDWVQADMMLDEARTVVNTTSLGMKGGADFKVSLDGLRKDAVVTDIVYNPLITLSLPLLKSAAAPLSMGWYVAASGCSGFERWFGQRPEADDATRAAVLA